MHNGHIQNFDYVQWSHFDIHPSTRSKQKRSSKQQPSETESFLLELEAFNRTFCFHLHPNIDLIHPKAKVTRNNKLGISTHEALSARAYRGYVMDVWDHVKDENGLEYNCSWRSHLPAFESYSETLGWVRISLRSEM